MVWAIHHASGFGKFFLNGDYVGWEDAVRQYWDTDIPLEEKRRIEARWGGFSTYDFSMKFIEDFGPLTERELVKEFRTEKTVKEIAALAKISNQVPIVHEDLKDVIEDIEPNVHQFWPITISMPRGKTYPEPYYGMRIGQFVDSFRPEQSAENAFQQRKAIYLSSDTKEKTSGLAFSGEEIGARHLWREKKLSKPNIFMSDALQAKIAAKGLQLPKHFQAKVV